MNAFLTAAAFIVLIAAAAYVIHRLNIEHADRIAVHRYSTPCPAAAEAPRRSPRWDLGPSRRPPASGGTTATGAWPLPAASPPQPYCSPQVSGR